MLSVLNIRNLALVDELVWELGSGLIGVTGETGAGKSIIVGAVKLVLGERADRSLVRTGADACSVEAVFSLPDATAVNAELAELGLEPCEDNQLVIKRVIAGTGSGPNRQFINCGAATLAALKAVGSLLIDLHGPHAHQSLLSTDRQLALLDAYAGCGKESTVYREAYGRLLDARREFEEFSESARSAEQEIDLLRHQVSEIQAADLKPDEESSIETRYQQASNSRRLIELANGIVAGIADEDHSVLSGLADIQRQARELERIDPAAADLTPGLETALVELRELESSLREYAERLDIDPQELAKLEERVELFENLKRKYGSTLAKVVSFGEEAAERLGKIENRSEELERLRDARAACEKAVAEAGAGLSAKRKKAAPRLARAISSILKDLGFKQSKFTVHIENLQAPSRTGLEEIDLQFAPNPGEPLKPLRVIASSGEMSRVMLAVKCALARQDRIPLLIFDEIDANVGGEIAHAVGSKMAELARAHQVICITHLPQVAAQATEHYRVDKQVAKGRTRSILSHLSERDGRKEELARMLGGQSSSARAHAETLLSGNREAKA